MASFDDHHRVVPENTKNLQACENCRIVLTRDQFARDVCPNCMEDTDVTDKFQGFMMVADPESSWLSRWFKLTNMKAGVYAMKLPDPEAIINEEGEDVDDYENLEDEDNE